MLGRGQYEAMPSTQPTLPAPVTDEPAPASGRVSSSSNGGHGQPTAQRNGHATVHRNGQANGGALPTEVLDELVVRIAGRDEADAIADLAARAGGTRPQGALMVGALHDRVLAAVSISSGEALSELT